MATVGLPFKRWKGYFDIPKPVRRLNNQSKIGDIKSYVQLIHAIDLFDTYDYYVSIRLTTTDKYFIKCELLDEMINGVDHRLLVKNKVFLKQLKSIINEQKKLIQRFRD